MSEYPSPDLMALGPAGIVPKWRAHSRLPGIFPLYSCHDPPEASSTQMATELRNRAREAEQSEQPDPSQTGARPRLDGARLSERPSPVPVPARGSRITRPSIRPSAFGIPRSSVAPAASPSSAPAAPVSTHGSAGGGLPAARPGNEPPVAHTARAASSREQTTPIDKRAQVPVPAVKTDIEELLPISQGVKSLPRPPRLPTFEPAHSSHPAPRRIPWASLSVFAVMLVGSLAPLTHYRGERQVEPADAEQDLDDGAAALVTAPLQSAPAAAPLVTVGAPLSTHASKPSAVDRIEGAFWGDPVRVHEALLEEAERALSADDMRLAETLFARALDFRSDAESDDARGAYGLSRVRLGQSDLEGAEGWLLLAIRQRPRHAEYRALHAEILQRRGRGSEAQLERTLARSLAHFPAETRSR